MIEPGAGTEGGSLKFYEIVYFHTFGRKGTKMRKSKQRASYPFGARKAKESSTSGDESSLLGTVGGGRGPWQLISLNIFVPSLAARRECRL